jgi:hypothetical protein
MAIAGEHLTPEQEELREQYAASHRGIRKRLKNRKFVERVKKKIADLESCPKPGALTREEFLKETSEPPR